MRMAIIATAVCMSLIGSCLAQTSTAAMIRVETRIPPQPLESALKEFAAATHMQVLFLTEDVKDLKTRGVSGKLTADEILSRLLSGTGLKYRYVDTTAVSIIKASSNARDTRNASTTVDLSHRARRPTERPAAHGHTPTDPPIVDDTPNTTHATSYTSTALGEIIVTAQKYTQRAFDVPISLQVLTGQELLQHGITDLSSLQYDVPGLYMNNTGTQRAVYLRGVGNTYGSGAMVGQYIDEADITAEGFTGESGFATDDNGLYDLQRVEVLKGPQGTLYGDGSIGGVIRYITNKPVLDQFQTSTDVAALFTESGAPSQRLQAMLNSPLVAGTLGVRLAGLFEHDGGWVDEPAASLRNINGSDLSDVRAEALWQPSAQFSVNAMQIIHRHTYGLGNGEDDNGNFTPAFETTLTPNGADNSNISNVTITFDSDRAHLVSSSTYLNERQDVYDNFNTLSTVSALLIPYSHSTNQVFSEELRLVHTGRGRWQWTVGGFYKHFRDTFLYPMAYVGLAASPLASASKIKVRDSGDLSNSLASFADTSFKLSGRLTLGAGLRYFRDDETSDVTSFALHSTTRQATTFPSTDPRFYVQYRVTQHINTYASASKGFRSGGFNTPPSAPYQPETLWSYDLGTKALFPAEGLAADVDLFYMNYSKFVTVAQLPRLYPDLNVGNARIKGADAALTWEPLDRWRMGVTTEILRTEFLTATALSGYAPGERLPFAPTYSFTASVQHSYRWNDRPGHIEVYYSETSRVQVRPPLAQSDILRFLNARVGIQWSDNLRLGVFAQNLLNDRGNASPEYVTGASVRPRPRTFGVEFHTSLP